MTTAPATNEAWRAAQLAARRWRLPFSRQAWRGQTGNWLGVGAGSSLDFQDHRAYAPGDDPRHIHWAAYARTGQLTMKLYRAEVAPVVDIAVDVSASMALTPAKAARADELLAFCIACADRAGAASRVHAVNGATVHSVAVEEVRSGHWRARLPDTPSAGVAPRFGLWRAGAMKVLVTDLLYPGDPAALLAPFATGAGVAVVFAPALAEEANLDWRGNIEVTDCETGSHRRQRVDEPLARRYAAAYARHFSLWREAARRKGVLLAALPAEGDFGVALTGAARATGAVEAA